MAYPTPGTAVADWKTGGTTTMAWPSGLSVGDLVLGLIVVNANSNTPSLTDCSIFASTTSNNGNFYVHYVHRTWTGTEGATEVVSITGNPEFCHAWLPISGWQDFEAGTANVARGQTVVPHNGVTASWGAEENLFVAMSAWEDGSALVSFPTDYTGGAQNVNWDSSSQVGAAISYRQLTSASDTPGSTDIAWSNERTVGRTFVVRPAAGGGFQAAWAKNSNGIFVPGVMG